MKIIFVSKEYPPSARSYGIGTYVWESAGGLSRAGHQVTVIAASDDATSGDDRYVGDVRVIRIPDVERSAPPPLTWKSLKSSRSLGTVYSWQAYRKVRELGIAYRTAVAQCLEKLIDEGSGQIVEFPGYRGESLIWATRPRRIPMVTRVHGRTAWIHRSYRTLFVPREHLMNSWETKELLAADRVSVVAAHMASKVGRRVSRSRIRTIYNGINTSAWSMNTSASEKLTRDDILFVGSLVKAKGTFLLLKAAEMLRGVTGWNGRLILVGRDGAEFQRYVRHRWGSLSALPEWICLYGHRNRDSLMNLYSTAGVCCLPSFNEGLNYTGLEAMAAGAVIVGSSQGMAELIGDAGFLFPAGCVDALCSTLRTAISLDENSRQVIRFRARLAARKSFDINLIVEQMISAYRLIIQDFETTVPLNSKSLLGDVVER